MLQTYVFFITFLILSLRAIVDRKTSNYSNKAIFQIIKFSETPWVTQINYKF